MNGLIRFSLGNPRAITVLVLTIVIAGGASLALIPADILPVYRSPAVQVLTFYNGMSSTNVEADITGRMERWVGQAAGTRRQESRSIVGASIIRNYYSDATDPSAALTQVNSLATAAIPNLPPGTLPPVVLPYDPTSSTPVCLIALNSKTQGESVLYDTARYQVRNMIMASPGANAPVVYGGRLRTILALLDRNKLQARNLSPVDVMDALDRYNIFLPAGSARGSRVHQTGPVAIGLPSAARRALPFLFRRRVSRADPKWGYHAQRRSDRRPATSAAWNPHGVDALRRKAWGWRSQQQRICKRRARRPLGFRPGEDLSTHRVGGRLLHPEGIRRKQGG